MAKFNIQNKCEDVVSYVTTITEKSPKKLRCDLIPNLRNTAFKTLECIIRANQLHVVQDHEERLALQKEALVCIRILEAFSEMCTSKNYLTNHQFATLTKKTCELYDMIVKWKDSDSKRI